MVCAIVILCLSRTIEVHDILAENFLPDLKPREEEEGEEERSEEIFSPIYRFLERNS